MAARTNLFEGDETFWTKYVKGRPRAPDSFFDRIFAYHAQHGGNFTRVHDAGAGVAVHSARLAQRFSNILVSDVSAQNIDIAKSRHEDPHQQYDYRVAKLEDCDGLEAATWTWSLQ